MTELEFLNSLSARTLAAIAVDLKSQAGDIGDLVEMELTAENLARIRALQGQYKRICEIGRSKSQNFEVDLYQAELYVLGSSDRGPDDY